MQDLPKGDTEMGTQKEAANFADKLAAFLERTSCYNSSQ